MTNFLIVIFSLSVASADAPARAASDGTPLRVVVETGAGAGCDANAVRDAIAAELHTAVVAPAASPVIALAGPRANTLLVSIDRARIVVTLPGRAGEDLTRSVAAPAAREARLRVVAWLAGNVARDQLATLALADAPAETLAPPAAPPAQATPSPAQTTPSPAAPESPAVALGGFARSAESAEGAEATPPAPARWALSLGGGPVVKSSSPSWHLAGQLEGHRTLGPAFVGAALDVGPRDSHPIGGALLGGAQLGVGKLHLEASVGVGVEMISERFASPGGVFTQKQAAAYGRAGLAASYPLVPELDVIAQLTGHLTLKSITDQGFVAATLGLCLRLP